MTTVVGYRDRDGAVWMGADSRSVGGRFIFPETVDKFVRHGRWTLGHTGMATVLALLRRKGAAIAEAESVYDVAELTQRLLKEADYRQRPDEDGAPDYAQTFIVSDGLGLWGICPDGSCWAPDWGFVAIGSGQEYAFGAAFVLHEQRACAETVVRMALLAAVAFDTGTGGALRAFPLP